MTHRDLAKLQLALYAGDASQFDCVCDGSTDDQVVYGIAKRDGITVVAFRGSVTPLDWFRDFTAIAEPFPHGKLGPVHPGFFAGMELASAEILKRTTGPRVIIGHSLGAARATLLTGLLFSAGQPPIARVVWGEPLSCFQPMADMICNVKSASYWNGQNAWFRDPVPCVPLSGLLERYVRCGKATDVCEFPTSGDWRVNLLSWHSMHLYVAATPEITVTA